MPNDSSMTLQRRVSSIWEQKDASRLATAATLTSDLFFIIHVSPGNVLLA